MLNLYNLRSNFSYYLPKLFISAVYCSRTVPTSPIDSIEALHDAEERAANDTDWNSFSRVVNYTCPEGTVLEYPDEVYYIFISETSNNSYF